MPAGRRSGGDRERPRGRRGTGVERRAERIPGGLGERYERVAYPSRPFPALHPERLAATASLFGLTTAPVERCRVLEVGCATGAHLLPMAASLPGSSFLGVDVAPSRIAEARRAIAALGLRNVEVEARGLETLGDGEPFDYIVAHGLYSWIDPALRDELLALCRRRLAPNGIAMVSYNALPGGHLRAMARGALRLFQGAAGADGGPPDQLAGIARGRQALALAARHAASDAPHAAALVHEEAEVSRLPDEYLFHDHLAPINDAVWFTDFVAHAARHDLDYLGEARLADMAPQRFAPAVQEEIAAASDELLESEQLMDLLLPRYFRRTLLCRAGTPLRRRLVWRDAASLCFTLPRGASADDEWPWLPDSPGWQHGASALRGALLAAMPRALSFAELASAMPEEPASLQDIADLPPEEICGELLLAALARAEVDATTRRWPVATDASGRPRTSPLVRWQATHDQDWVTNLRHETVRVDAAERALLVRLDGLSDPRVAGAGRAAPGGVDPVDGGPSGPSGPGGPSGRGRGGQAAPGETAAEGVAEVEARLRRFAADALLEAGG